MELILGRFATFKKATISFVMSIHMEQLGFRRTDFHEILYLLFEILSRNFKLIKIWRETGTVLEHLCALMLVTEFLEWKVF